MVAAPRQTSRYYRMHTDAGVHASSGSTRPASDKPCDCGQRQSREVAYVVGADPLLQRVLLDVKGFISPEVVCLGSVREFAQYVRNDDASCLLIDLCAHHDSDFDHQCQMATEGAPPVVFVYRHSDVSAAIRALKSGAVELLTAPVNPLHLAEAMLTAIALDRRQRQQRLLLSELSQRFELLTPREREVLPLVVKGLLNKQAAGVLGISETTLQIHRSHVLHKMQADSVADLVRMAVALEIPVWADSEQHQAGVPSMEQVAFLRSRWS